MCLAVNSSLGYLDVSSHLHDVVCHPDDNISQHVVLSGHVLRPSGQDQIGKTEKLPNGALKAS
jgi:hypothetical protein